MSAFDLTGRTALVTGGAGGLGREMVAALAAAGARVAIHHLGQQDEARELAEKLRGDGAEVAVVEGDVTSWDEAAAFVAATEDALGPIDVLVNNAGYMTAGRITEMTLEQWSRTIDVDLTGVFVVSRHVLVGMLERGSGAIVNVSSQLAYKGAEDFASYCAAKAGVLGLTRAMAREVGPQVRVNAIAPGPITTPMTDASFDEELTRARTASLVAGRMGLAHEVAPSVVFLASEAASYIHGQTIHVNGGGVLS
ncbi:SDR family oxidoreductase [Nocardioides sp. LMS-CY]|uniref:3-oxoacyl-[acyl-carrier protein] reductase n=1 Tax=Nocardioides soli TaxID=1036020 RepID=A0A7W4VWE1_9ACTN|nr:MULTISPECIES: SDR family oxidoreductase [Nocardioides]MBB3042885.1 3-oxoacyl-[acyl-carrier protein] reductase [Nocardioides soli]QWF22989.1 SDR family oxidoreductase [Nocardioides sp. LMS-CY]